MTPGNKKLKIRLKSIVSLAVVITGISMVPPPAVFAKSPCFAFQRGAQLFERMATLRGSTTRTAGAPREKLKRSTRKYISRKVCSDGCDDGVHFFN